MTKQNFAAISVIIDESGSMLHLQQDTIGGFNSFLREQKELPGEAIFSLTKFNYAPTRVYDCVPLNDVAELNADVYRPTGGTALLDAVGDAIDRMGAQLSAMKEEERPSRVVVLIITDGHENSSSQFTNDKVREMIEHQQSKYSWEFLFIGANIDAFKAGTNLGVSALNSVQYTGSSYGTQVLYNSISSGLSRVRSGETKTGASILGTTSIEVDETLTRGTAPSNTK